MKIKDNLRKKGTYLSIVTGMILSLVFVTGFSSKIFLANTPAIDPFLWVKIRNLPFYAMAFFKHPFNTENRIAESFQMRVKKQFSSEKLVFTPLSKGIYAAENESTKQRIIKVEKGTKLEVRTIELKDGRTIQVFIPVKE